MRRVSKLRVTRSALRAPTTPSTGSRKATVFVIDDDPSVRKGLSRLIRSAGLGVEMFSSAREFLSRKHYDGHGCIVLDIRMPGLSGLDLQDALTGDDYGMPIVFITGHGDISMSVRAMKRGAVDFLTKPFDYRTLLGAIEKALCRDREARREHARVLQARQRLETLTLRERSVLALVVKGLLNKQIAAELGISEKTVKVHRGRVMRKMGVTSVAELVPLAERGSRRAETRSETIAD